MAKKIVIVVAILSVICGAELTVFAQEKKSETITISETLHHIGDGQFGSDSNCARNFQKKKAEAEMFRRSFRIMPKAVQSAQLTLDYLCGHDPGEPVLVMINGKKVGEITDNRDISADGKNYEFTVDVNWLRLGGGENSFKIIAPTLNKGVDDLEFRGVRLVYHIQKPELLELRFVRYADNCVLPDCNQFTPIEGELPYGVTFFLEASYSGATPDLPSQRVAELDWGQETARSITLERQLERQGDTAIYYRSTLLILKPEQKEPSKE